MCKDMDLVFSTGQKNIFFLNFKKDTALERFAVCHPCPAFSPTQRWQRCPILQVKSLSLVRMRPACCAGTGNRRTRADPKSKALPSPQRAGSFLILSRETEHSGCQQLTHSPTAGDSRHSEYQLFRPWPARGSSPPLLCRSLPSLHSPSPFLKHCTQNCLSRKGSKMTMAEKS